MLSHIRNRWLRHQFRKPLGNLVCEGRDCDVHQETACFQGNTDLGHTNFSMSPEKHPDGDAFTFRRLMDDGLPLAIRNGHRPESTGCGGDSVGG